MNYKLAKQLKDAGFPFKPDVDDFPTLSELIEACGIKFLYVEQYVVGDTLKFYAVGRDLLKRKDIKIDGLCETPEESVAKLYIKLNKENKWTD